MMSLRWLGMEKVVVVGVDREVRRQSSMVVAVVTHHQQNLEESTKFNL
jgi:hypothetical protein